MSTAALEQAVEGSFTLASYREFLSRTIEAYTPEGFEVLSDPDLASRRFCIIRHDVDMSPARAHAVAKIEAGLGVSATYMVLLTSDFYNALEARSAGLFHAIGQMGHRIGLHFDAARHGIESEAGLEQHIAREARILETLIDSPVTCFSFHNTTSFTMACQAPSYAGLWNAYAGILQQEVSYVSDSNGHWRYRSWLEALAEGSPRLQVLTHPEWWVEHEFAPAEKLNQLLDETAATSWREYCEVIRNNGRTNLSGSPAALANLEDIPAASHILRQWLAGQREAAFLAIIQLLSLASPRPSSFDTLAGLAVRVLNGEKVPAETLETAFAEASLQFRCDRLGASRALVSERHTRST